MSNNQRETQRFVFAGNRFFVLEKLLEQKLPIVRVFALKNSYLARELEKRKLDFVSLENKRQLIDGLRELDFDIFLSNGCPFILPIAELMAGSAKRFINIHPSYLPDLRGAHPVTGALLFGHDAGATCHLMNDAVDAGDIIAQLKIEMTPDLDCGLLYQLSFQAEQEVFLSAQARDFQPLCPQEAKPAHLYYTRKASDLEIDLSQGATEIINKIRAFNTASQGAYFFHKGRRVTVFDGERVTNSFLLRRIDCYRENEVAFRYDNRLLIRKGELFLKLKQVLEDITPILPGDILGVGNE